MHEYDDLLDDADGILDTDPGFPVRLVLVLAQGDASFELWLRPVITAIDERDDGCSYTVTVRDPARLVRDVLQLPLVHNLRAVYIPPSLPPGLVQALRRLTEAAGIELTEAPIT